MCESRKTIYDLIDNKQEGNGYCVKERELYLFILPMRYLWLVLTGLVYTGSLPAQKYHALQGSRYAGSLAVHENPAGIQATPFKWDITVLGAQMKNNTNTFTIRIILSSQIRVTLFMLLTAATISGIMTFLPILTCSMPASLLAGNKLLHLALTSKAT